MFDHKAIITGELEAGETVLWSAQPRQGIILCSSDALMIPFSLLWGGFALSWEYEVISSDAPWLMAFLGLPFVVIGLYLIAGRFYYDAMLRKKTFYGITERRIIMLSGIWKKQALYISIIDIESVTAVKNSNGSGEIILGPADDQAAEAINSAFQNQVPIPGQEATSPRLNNLVNVDTPYAIIQKLRRQLGSTGSSPAD